MSYEDKPPVVIPENLSEMSPQSAWNLAINTIAPLAEWDSFWNDGRFLHEDLESLKVKEKTDGKRKIRYKGPIRRLACR